ALSVTLMMDSVGAAALILKSTQASRRCPVCQMTGWPAVMLESRAGGLIGLFHGCFLRLRLFDLLFPRALQRRQQRHQFAGTQSRELLPLPRLLHELAHRQASLLNPEKILLLSFAQILAVNHGLIMFHGFRQPARLIGCRFG